MDWDARHDYSQQDAFWSDPSVLTISVQQARNFPPGTGGTDARGGLDANYIDPSARLCLHSNDYTWITDQVATMAGEHCDGRLVMTHEGGYALPYLPLCFLRIIERLSGCRSGIEDPFLARWGNDFASVVSTEAQDVLKECASFVEELARQNP